MSAVVCRYRLTGLRIQIKLRLTNIGKGFTRAWDAIWGTSAFVVQVSAVDQIWTVL